MSGSSSKSIAAIKYPGIESVGIDKHQTFVANLMKLGFTFYGSQHSSCLKNFALMHCSA